jgi:hypothetical protein
MNYDYAWDDSDSDGQVMAIQYGLKPPLTRPPRGYYPPDLALEGPRYPRQVGLGN